MKISRVRGDTYPEVHILRVDTSPINLNTLSIIELAIRKPSGTTVVSGVKNSDAATGEVTFPLTEELVADVGVFYYDISAVDTESSKATFVSDRISFSNDVNKT